LVTLPPNDAARMYVCGITPYDSTHLGHAATYVGFDLLNRALRNAGHDVIYVQNVTDIDDPLLERAHARGIPWSDLAQRETERFRQDMTALRVLPPAHFVGVSEAVTKIISRIEMLKERGSIYRVGTDLYFEVSADPSFGRVSSLDRDVMLKDFAERGGDPDRPGKKDPLDCLVWRLERPGEPAWDSRLGRGRPGWHIECSAMSGALLGETFDIHAGGLALRGDRAGKMHHHILRADIGGRPGFKPRQHDLRQLLRVVGAPHIERQPIQLPELPACPIAIERCKDEEPPLEERARSHRAACWRV